ncbi:MAG: DegT/DnrJ/EryC1/StrS family aminotransferase [Acidobacteria bacterium]|nr:DegT/DnrJ/EryC1/StrS family aminotransferase [Acidobacteriota bacterium]
METISTRYNDPDTLALNGGTSIRNGNWPTWPQYGSMALDLVRQVFDGGRWAVSGTWTGQCPLEQTFAEQFAEFLGVKYCIPTDHCSSALVMSMKSLGIGPGDEVIVPGLTWVACASTVLRVGAIPILVDIEPNTLCLSPEAVESAITTRTAAILVVHLYSAMANMDKLTAISQKYSIPLIEDCAQAHGARWSGQRAGSLGIIGVFSMQQGKALTCGEGGAAVTSDPRLFSLLEQLRNDGRRLAKTPRVVGHMHLEEVGEVIGANLAMSEFQLAVLLDGLNRLEEQNKTRASRAIYLDKCLREISGLEFIRPHHQNDERAYYHYVVRYEPESFAYKSVEAICRALEAELGFWVHPAYRPLNDHPLYRPHLDKNLAHTFADLKSINPTRFELPEASRQHKRSILFHHSVLLGSLLDMDDIATAFEKVQRLSSTLPDD